MTDKKEWLTQGIRNSSIKLKLLHKATYESNREEDKHFYNLYKRIYRKVIRAAKKLHNDHIYFRSLNKSKAVWSIINNDLNNNKIKQTQSKVFKLIMI